MHRSVHVCGHPGEHVLRGNAETGGPGGAHEVVVSPDAARRDDRRAGADLEVADDVPRRLDPARGGTRLQDRPTCAGDRSVGGDELGHSVAGEDRDATLAFALFDRGDERCDDTGPGAPGDVESRDGVTGTECSVPPSFGPSDHGEQTHSAVPKPRSLLPGGELQIGLCPSARPVVFRAVERGGPEPVLRGEGERIANAHPPLLRGVDEEQAAERPPRLPAEVRARFLVDQDHPATGLQRLTRCDETGEPPSDDQYVCRQGRVRHELSVDS